MIITIIIIFFFIALLITCTGSLLVTHPELADYITDIIFLFIMWKVGVKLYRKGALRFSKKCYYCGEKVGGTKQIRCGKTTVICKKCFTQRLPKELIYSVDDTWNEYNIIDYEKWHEEIETEIENFTPKIVKEDTYPKTEIDPENLMLRLVYSKNGYFYLRFSDISSLNNRVDINKKEESIDYLQLRIEAINLTINITHASEDFSTIMDNYMSEISGSAYTNKIELTKEWEDEEKEAYKLYGIEEGSEVNKTLLLKKRRELFSSIKPGRNVNIGYEQFKIREAYDILFEKTPEYKEYQERKAAIAVKK